MRAARFVLALAVLAAPARAQDAATVIDPDPPASLPPADVLQALSEPYSHAVAALGAWAVWMIAVMIVSTVKQARDKTPSGHPVRDYDDQGYRASRAHMNAVEAAGPFIAATAAAILAGAPPFWVNLFASLFLLARIVTFAVHVGTTNQMARSLTWTVGHVCILLLAIMAVIGAFA